ncbi:MAG: Veg family protein [Coriobacteriia bacterium]|nr:Veg family protein [Coriobacteriia bacterium]
MELNRLAEAEGDIRTVLEDMTGSIVCIRANMGRSKVMECQGMILQTHPSVFLVEVRKKRNRRARASYKYVDVLTGSVELSHPESGEPVFPWIECSN